MDTVNTRLKHARWIIALVAGLVLFTYVFYRYVYTHTKRLRVMVPGKVYRSGQMTAEGFRDAIKEHKIRTVLNLQQDNVDPDLPRTWFDRRTIKESALCKELGVRYVLIEPDLVHPPLFPEERPQAIDEFLRLMDDESNYPVLIHCKAGLHRTGILAAVYRMEYQGWTVREAYDELKAHGFGDKTCTCSNIYVTQYVLTYKKGQRLLSESAVANKKNDKPVE